jgi:hypothetical protein
MPNRIRTVMISLLPGILLSGILLPVRVVAQTATDTEHEAQLWPDVQATINLKDRWSLVLFGTARLGRGWTAINNEQLGVGVTKRLGSGFSTSLMYRRVYSQPQPGRNVVEDRLFGDLTPRWALTKRWQLSDRNRFEWRRIDGRTSFRYRNRPQLERPISIGEKRITPYISFETFFDSRFREWSRFQIYTGTRIPLSRHLTLDGFYMHQWDDRARPGYIDVVGAQWRFEF